MTCKHRLRLQKRRGKTSQEISSILIIVLFSRENGPDRDNVDVEDSVNLASFNPMSYFSPTSVFALSAFLPSYLGTPTLPKSSQPRPEPEESEESEDSLRTEEVSIHSTDTQAEAKGSPELNNQHSEVFLVTSSYFLFTNIIMTMMID